MQNRNAALFLIMSGLLSACGKKDNGNEGPALPPGSYHVEGPVCLSTGKPPAYPDSARRLNLFDFSDTTNHTLTIEGFVTKREISNGSCTLIVEQPLRTNIGWSFIQMQSRKSIFMPEGCKLKVTAKGQTFEVGSLSSEVFSERSSEQADLPYELTASTEKPGSLTMLSQDIDALNVLWNAYGCAEVDRLKWILTPSS